MALHLRLRTELDKLLEATEATLIDKKRGNRFLGVCRSQSHYGRKKNNLLIRLLDTGDLSISCKDRCPEEEIYADLKRFGTRLTKFEASEPFVKCPRAIIENVGKTLGEINPTVPPTMRKIKFSAIDILVYLAQRSYSDESVKGSSYPLIETLMQMIGMSKSAVSKSRARLVALKFMVPVYRVRPPKMKRRYYEEVIEFRTQVEAKTYLKLNRGAHQSSTSFTFPEIEISNALVMPDSTSASILFDEPRMINLKPRPRPKLKLKLAKLKQALEMRKLH